jgi:Tubulin/FtsZ family, GTPase domain
VTYNTENIGSYSAFAPATNINTLCNLQYTLRHYHKSVTTMKTLHTRLALLVATLSLASHTLDAFCPTKPVSTRSHKSHALIVLYSDDSPYVTTSPPCVIKVIGVGGGGGNAVNRMIQTRIEGVSFWAINTDAQALAKSLAPNVLNIGRQLTRGLGAGGDPVVGKQAALENVLEMEHICDGADMIFITAGAL